MNIKGALLALLLSSILASSQFVQRNGLSLYLDGHPYTFAGSNMYWLGLDENVGGIHYPTKFRVDDAFYTASEMGANVVRGHTLGISTGNPLSFEKSLNNFDFAEPLDVIDYSIYVASKFNIKLVIPLTDNWHYYHGGKHDFTDWNNLTESLFYTNNKVISDFKHYITNLLNHKNKYTGLLLRDDPTILAWETGNELRPPVSWTKTISEHIKTISPNHLVLDGNPGIDLLALRIETVDIYTGHYYPMSITEASLDYTAVHEAGKVFYIGEYGWAKGSYSRFSEFLDVIETLRVPGDTYWSFFPHLDTHGFVQHNDGYTLHYPGDSPDMEARVKRLRDHAFTVRNIPVPKHLPPKIPLITMCNATHISWRGAAAAGKYNVFVSEESENGPYSQICDQCADDNDTPWAFPKAIGECWL
eukprot:TRINITY_DN7272_c0_g1_i1.p1 TRINITY_DN7272_c0_g1~~TRINITY_DN7272_c0_g1_i1.p1  ORF type:complete len:416 (+),score=76.80 TRINITY_DN7272_c0_g1_i1:2-1249(+)